MSQEAKPHGSPIYKNMKLTKNEARERLERYKKFMDFNKFSLSEKCQLLQLWSERVLNMDWEQAEEWLFSEE